MTDGNKKIPDGPGTLLVTTNRHQELFDGVWIMGAPGNGTYRFANGWKWYGDFSDRSAIGLMRAGNQWMDHISFDEAQMRARAAIASAPQTNAVVSTPPPATNPPPSEPPPTNKPAVNLVDAIIITDPGEVTVSYAVSGRQYEQVSDADGNLQFKAPAGEYHLICQKQGHRKQERDFSLGSDGANVAFCRIKLDELYEAGATDRSGDARRAIGAESFPFFLGQVAPDPFALVIRERAQRIRSFLRGGPVAPQSAAAREISSFWRQVAESALQGYQADSRKAKLGGQLDGNRRFLEIALGAAAADFESTESAPNWGAEYGFPFPLGDLIETAASPARTRATNYYWPALPTTLLRQCAAANILPRALDISLEQSPQSPKLPMVLIPNPNGRVRTGAIDSQWHPAAPFYMAATETSFGQMRVYAQWAQHETATRPKEAKWFAPIPPSKQLVGAQNAPYTGVTIDEALSFCNWLSFLHGREPAYTRLENGAWTLDRTKAGLRLPDEYEWEYAARFGFDFLSSTGTPQWKEISNRLSNIGLGELPDSRLVYFSTASQTTRAIDDPSAWIYPLGLRDMCGNAAELCLDQNSSASPLLWVIRGGHCASMYEGAVMPWSKSAYDDNTTTRTGFRVVLPVPLDDFLND